MTVNVPARNAFLNTLKPVYVRKKEIICLIDTGIGTGEYGMRLIVSFVRFNLLCSWKINKDLKNKPKRDTDGEGGWHERK